MASGAARAPKPLAQISTMALTSQLIFAVADTVPNFNIQ
jgi:hypothetical protein